MANKYIIYRKSDGRISSCRMSERDIDIETELSHYGDGYAAVAVDSLPVRDGSILKYLGGQVVKESDPAAEKLNTDRASGIEKLKKLGLTEDEIKALPR